MNVTLEIERLSNGQPKPEWICPSCHDVARLVDVRANLSVCPHCGHHLRVRRPRAHHPARRRRDLPRALGERPHPGPPAVQRPGALSGPAPRGPGQDRSDRGHRHGHRPDRRQRLRARRDGLRLHGRQHGQRGRREALAQRGACRRRGPPAGRRLHIRRGPHAGGHPLAHADGQDELRGRPAERVGRALRRRPGRPVHRRRGRQLRHPGRRLHRRAGRAALLQRTARDPADHAGVPPGGVQHGRTQSGAGPSGRGRPPSRAQAEARQLPRPVERR